MKGSTMTISDVVSKLGVSMTSERAASNPNMIDPLPGSFHWLCTLTCNGRKMVVPFTQGAAYVQMRKTDRNTLIAEPTPPELDRVLDCLASDASGYDNSRDFEDWCSEYGYDTDRRKAEKCYRDCGEQAKHLRHLLGEDSYRELLEAERL